MKNDGVLWVRVSSLDQSHGYSPDAQLNALKAAAEREKINVVRVFQITESAKMSENRKRFKEMIEYISSDGVEYLVAYAIDRITRNYNDLNIIQNLIENKGTKVFIVHQNKIIDKLSAPIDKFLFATLGNVAYLDNMMRGERTKLGMEGKAKKGGYPTRAPIGYLNIADPNDTEPDLRKKRRIIIIDPDRAPLIKCAFEAYSEGGWSLATLRDELNRRGLRTKPTKEHPSIPISKHGLQKILDNRFYYGEFRWDKRLWKGQHEPLISRELYERVQTKMDENCCSPRKDTKKWFSFKPFLKCGYCGASITAEVQKGRWGRGNYIYYRCSSPKDKNCPQKYMREEKVDEIFSDALGELYIDDAIAQKICQQLKVSHIRHDAFLKKELRRLQSQHTEKSNHLNLIYEDRLNGVISIEQYKTHRQRIENELGQIQIAMERLNRVNFDYKEQGSTVLELLKGFKRIYLKQSLEGKAKILAVVLHSCILRGKDTAFVWKRPFDLLFTIGRLTGNTGVITGREWGE